MRANNFCVLLHIQISHIAIPQFTGPLSWAVNTARPDAILVGLFLESGPGSRAYENSN